MKRKLLTIILCFAVVYGHSQIYDDYIGAGHSQGVTITTSNNASSTNPDNTANGAGLGVDMYGASRFLNQSTIGADYETIETVANMGVSNWLDQQLALAPEVSFEDTTTMIWNHFLQEYNTMYGTGVITGNNSVLQFSIYWRMAYWNNILKSNDILRQRVALALSEILVISENSDLNISMIGLSNYYDMLYTGAFGNYRDLLFNVTMHPAMGYYLSHLNNPKANLLLNIHPDENYAREVMQLFSIGLYELNIDGTRKINNGAFIPTYDNDDIKEFAKVFTGFMPGAYSWHWDPAVAALPVTWGSALNTPITIDMTLPMSVNNNYHQSGSKTLLNGQVVASGQSGVQDVNDAIDNLFNHDNIAPFISKHLIQRLIKSNPTPAYVQRVAEIFNDNGQGIKGDLGAVVKAILMDAEARDCSWLTDATAGKLREPFVKATQILKAFNASNNSGKLYGFGFLVEEVSHQHVLNSPSVFNFYLPNFQPNGAIADANMVAPEFQLHTSTASVDFLNFIYDSFLADIYLFVSTKSNDQIIGIPETDYADFDPNDWVYLDLLDEEALSLVPEELVERLDLILASGQLRESVKTTIVNSITPLQFDPSLMVRAALYMITLSPDYNIRK